MLFCVCLSRWCHVQVLIPQELMSALAAAGITHPGMSEIEREYAGKKLTPLKLDAESGDTILVPEEVAREMQRLAAEVRTCPVWI